MKSMNGDLEAFNQLVLIFQDKIYHLALYFLGNEQDAEDATQDAFLTAYRKLGTFRGGSFQSWLLRITTNLCLDRLRYQKRRHTINLEPSSSEGEEIDSSAWIMDESQNPEEVVECREFLATLHKTLIKLPVQFRMAVVLVDLLQLDYAEAAYIMSISLGTVKSRLSRGRKKIRDIWISESFDRSQEVYSRKMLFQPRVSQIKD